MEEQHCKLCGIPTPDPPVTDPDVEGAFCCRGCLHIYKTLGEAGEQEAAEVKEQLQRGGKPLPRVVPDDASEMFLKVEGMHCATCERFLETMASREEGVYGAEASYASDMIKVYYDPARSETSHVTQTLSRYGYKAHAPGEKAGSEEQDTVARLLLGGLFSMMVMMLYILFLYPSYVGGAGLVPLESTDVLFMSMNIAVMSTFVLAYTGFPILRGAWVSLRVGKPNMDLLVALAALSAYLYSIGAIISGLHEIYFDVSVTIVMVVSLGNFYEHKVKSRAGALLSDITSEQSREARLMEGGDPKTVDLADLKAGQRVLVRPGERVPVDGIISEGGAAMDESLITGESLPVYRTEGDRVLGGTVVTDQALLIEVGPEAQSTLDRLVQMMWKIQTARPGAQRLADRIASVFVPLVLTLALLALGWQWWIGYGFREALLTALSVLIVSCPCALGLATPLAIASGLREALKRNMVIRNVSVFEEAAEINTVAFDKTGTLTTGRMKLVHPAENTEALSLAAAVEQFASHPAARAITEASQQIANRLDVEDFKNYPKGASARIGDRLVWVGEPGWMAEQGMHLLKPLRNRVDEIKKRAHLPVAVGWDGEIRDILEIGDELRPEVAEIFSTLENDGRQIVVITGDSEQAAQRLRNMDHVDEVYAEVRPEAKTALIERLAKHGKVAMVGDGNNDAPALARADLGIAFGAEALAADSADLVITDRRLALVPAVFNLSHHTNIRIRQNLGWAFLYNLVAIPLAIAGMINPLFAALAMATSSLLVVGNSVRKMKL